MTGSILEKKDENLNGTDINKSNSKRTKHIDVASGISQNGLPFKNS